MIIYILAERSAEKNHSATTIQEVHMTFKNNSTQRDIKKIFAAIMCALIAVMFLSSLVRMGFAILRLLFGLFCFYLAFAFFRSSKQ